MRSDATKKEQKPPVVPGPFRFCTSLSLRSAPVP